MSSILVSYPPTNEGSNGRSSRGRNAATQAPGDSMRVKKQSTTPSKNVNGSLGLIEKESDFDSNYQSSDKSSPESPRPLTADMGRSGQKSPYGSVGVERQNSWSCSDSETPPISDETASNDSNRVTVEIGGTDQKIYHIPVGETGDEPVRHENILEATMVPGGTGPIVLTLTPEEEERQRSKRQSATERCSLITLIPALGMLIICPWFMLPIFTVPNPHTTAFKIAILAGTPLALLFLAMGCLLGNIIWYYDASRGKFRWFVNCGGKIKDHYWGHDLFNGFPKKKSKTVQEI